MTELTGPDTGNEAPKPPPLLRDILLELVFKPGRGISPEIDRIDLGVFAEEAMLLANMCFEDDQHSNFGKLVYATGNKKVLLPEFTFGAKNGGTLAILGAVPNIPKETAVKEALNIAYPAMVMVTRENRDIAFSLEGLALLLQPDSFDHPISCLFVVGKTQNTLVFRGENTPQLAEEEIKQRAGLWDWQLQERIRQFAKPGMSSEEVIAIGATAADTLFGQIRKKYHLYGFAGSSDGNEVSLMSV